jgi:hypothetical protein
MPPITRAYLDLNLQNILLISVKSTIFYVQIKCFTTHCHISYSVILPESVTSLFTLSKLHEQTINKNVMLYLTDEVHWQEDFEHNSVNPCRQLANIFKYI